MLHWHQNVFEKSPVTKVNPVPLILVLLVATVLTNCRKPYTFTRELSTNEGIVVTAHPIASDVGTEILSKGGNAIDAAVAVAFTLTVVYPRAGNLGGGGFMVYRSSERELLTLDFREKAPGNAHDKMFLDTAGNILPGASLKTILAAGVPGSVAGLWSMHDSLGILEWREVMTPAITYARSGYRITQEEAERLNQYRDEFQNANPYPIPFTQNDRWKEGDLLKQPELANTLQRISDNGKKEFYEGETASKLADFMEARNGMITLKDLSDYEAVWRNPLITEVDSFKFISIGLPSSGGIVFSAALKMAFPLLNKNLPLEDAENVHVLIEAERRAFRDRTLYMGDMDFVHVPVDSILSDDYLKDKMSDFNPAHSPDSDEGHIVVPERFETTHFSIADKFGNAVSVTTTLNGNYGNKIWVPGLGFFLNNEMDDFTIKPGELNQFMLAGGKPNIIEPGKRMLSSMCPMIIEKSDSLYMITGSPGGSTIITTNLQIFLQYAVFGKSLYESVTSPRFHHQDVPNLVVFEENAFSPITKSLLQKKGHTLEQVEVLGCAEVIVRNSDGSYIGVSDTRGDGHVSAR